jgi:hypothetical protein
MSGQPSNVIPLRPDCGPSGRTTTTAPGTVIPLTSDRAWMARIRRGAPLPPPDWAAIDAVLAEMGLLAECGRENVTTGYVFPPRLRMVR